MKDGIVEEFNNMPEYTTWGQTLWHTMVRERTPFTGIWVSNTPWEDRFFLFVRDRFSDFRWFSVVFTPKNKRVIFFCCKKSYLGRKCFRAFKILLDQLLSRLLQWGTGRIFMESALWKKWPDEVIVRYCWYLCNVKLNVGMIYWVCFAKFLRGWLRNGRRFTFFDEK